MSTVTVKPEPAGSKPAKKTKTKRRRLVRKPGAKQAPKLARKKKGKAGKQPPLPLKKRLSLKKGKKRLRDGKLRARRKKRRKGSVRLSRVTRAPHDVAYGSFQLGLVKPHRRLPISGRPLTRKVSVIVLTWNGLEYTKKCLESLKAALPAASEVIVYDNGSTDGTPEYLRSLNWIKPVLGPTNIGFVAGNREALLHADPSSDLVLLNNDIIIDQPDFLTLLQETAEQSPQIGIVGCRLQGPDGNLHHAGTYIYPDTCRGEQIGGNEIDIQQYTAIRDVQGVVFACAYIKREILDKIGFLDADYFSYFEDTDYCLKALTAGYRVMYDGRVTLTHFHNTSTKVNNVSFWDMYGKSQDAFRRKWHDRMLAQYDIGVNWHSVVNLPMFGYADSSKNFMIALDNKNVNVHYRYVYGAGSPIPLSEPETSADPRINIFRRRHYNAALAEVVYGQGDVFHRNEGRYKIGFTMLEVDGLPADWVKQSNMMDEVWVPSNFNVQTFRESGVHVPIHVIPLGVDSNYFHPGIRSNRFSEKFTFLSVFEWGERKAPELLLRTFARTFSDRDDVLLVCKITNNDPAIDVPAEIRKLGLGSAVSRILVLHNNNIPSYMMGSLYRSADCFVLPTRGEGWGMPILEAMACGIPTIATQWSAQTQFFNETTGHPIRVKQLVPAEARCAYYQGFRWAEPDADHLSHLMRHVYTHREAVKQRSLNVAYGLHESMSWSSAAAAIKQRLAAVR